MSKKHKNMYNIYYYQSLKKKITIIIIIIIFIIYNFIGLKILFFYYNTISLYIKYIKIIYYHSIVQPEDYEKKFLTIFI